MAPRNPNPIPNIPAHTRLPVIETTRKTAGSVSVPTSTSFYYAGIQSIWLWWLVDLELLSAYVNPYQMTPYDFGGGKGAVNVNFFNATALYGNSAVATNGIGGFNETELNVVSFASKVARNVPTGLTLQDFLAHGEPTKRVGNMRLWVACDDAVAVAAGQQVFFENKFLCSYTYSVPALNNPGQAVYDWSCHDPDKPKLDIYTTTVDLAGLTPTQGNPSEWIDLSFDAKSRRPVGSRRNYFGMYNTYQVPKGSKAVQLAVGKSEHPMRTDMRKLLGSRKAVAIQTFASPTCIAEVAGYYADL